MTPNQNLSKQEIEELQQAVNSTGGTAEVEQVKSYDFTHPDKLSRQNVRALQFVFSSLERPWTATLSHAVKAEVNVSIGNPEQATLGAFIESLPVDRVVATVKMDPFPGEAYLEMPTGFALWAAGRMAGSSNEAPGEPRELTQIELSIAKRLVNRLCKDLSRAWEPVTPVRFAVSDMHDSAEELEIDPEQRVIAVGIDLKVAGTDLAVNFALPVISLDKVLDLLHPQRWVRIETVPDGIERETVADLIDSVPVEMAAELGRVKVSMEGLMSMEVGDVIRLDTAANDLLDVRIGGMVKFRGRPGLTGKRLSVQIQEQVISGYEPVALQAAR